MNESSLRVDIPEQASFSFELAGIGSRFLALSLDMLFQIAAFILVLLGLSGAAQGMWSAAASLYSAFTIIGAAVLFFVYFIIFEGVLHGRTPGKAICRLRVVDRTGRPLGWTGAVARNLLRLIDFLPLFYGVGVMTMFLSRESRRLGDMVAGTVVVREPSRRRTGLQDLRQSAHTREPVSGRVSRYPVMPDELALIRDLLQKRGHMNARAYDALCVQVAQPFFERFQIPPQHRYAHEQFLQMLWQENQGM